MSLQSDITPLNSCKEAVSTGEEKRNKLSSTGMAGQSRMFSDFSYEKVYKRRKLLTNSAVFCLPVENRPGCSEQTDDNCIASSLDNSQTLLNVVPSVTPSTTIDCNDALDYPVPSISRLHHLEKPSEDGTGAELPGRFTSIKEMCISALQIHRSLGGVSATRTCASLNNNGSLGGESATSTCASLKVTGVADANGSRSCKICRRSVNPLKMLLCDNCEEAFHGSCARAKVKKSPRVAELSDWYCQPCIRKNPKCLLKSFKRSISMPRIGKGYQAEVPEWAGPVSNGGSDFDEPFELDPSVFLTSWNVSRPAAICNWLQCQKVTYENDAEGTKCSKWRRAPYSEVQTEDWDCSCAVTWDPNYADCAVPQELDDSKVQKDLQYVNEWRRLMLPP